MKIIIFFLIVNLSQANEIEHLVIKSIKEQITQRIPNAFINEEIKIQQKGLSGAQIIEEKKAQIRQQILEKNIKSKKELTLEEQHKLNLKELKNKHDTTLLSWKSENQQTLKNWAVEEKKFLKKLNTYKNNLDEVVSPDKVSHKIIKEKISKPIMEDVRLIPHAFSIPIKDQGARATCSAFAAIRALELNLLKKNGQYIDLSEQYFYWLAKPDCRQKSSCSVKGSWAGYGLDESMNSTTNDIPTEESCPYNHQSQNNNETHIPLSKDCQKGFTKVRDYQKINSLNQAVEQIEKGRAVIIGIKLTDNFYVNKGLILESEIPINSQIKDQHTLGHAIVLVGTIKLPPEMNEGRVCFVATNSWTEGWGIGGHSCLSENWLLKMRQNSPMLAL